jgi:hypothetical protein
MISRSARAPRDFAAALSSRASLCGTVLDFDGVVDVSGPFLDALLALESPESLADRLVGANTVVDAALAAWVDRRSRPTPVERQQRRPKVRIPQQRPAPVVLERAPTKDDRFTPTRLVQRLRHALRGYIESAYPLPEHLEEDLQHLERGGFGGRRRVDDELLLVVPCAPAACNRGASSAFRCAEPMYRIAPGHDSPELISATTRSRGSDQNCTYRFASTSGSTETTR